MRWSLISHTTRLYGMQGMYIIQRVNIAYGTRRLNIKYTTLLNNHLQGAYLIVIIFAICRHCSNAMFLTMFSWQFINNVQFDTQTNEKHRHNVHICAREGVLVWLYKYSKPTSLHGQTLLSSFKEVNCQFYSLHFCRRKIDLKLQWPCFSLDSEWAIQDVVEKQTQTCFIVHSVESSRNIM